MPFMRKDLSVINRIYYRRVFTEFFTITICNSKYKEWEKRFKVKFKIDLLRAT